MKHGSLFSGIGGFDLGFQRAGIETAWQVEIDAYCRRILARHFPQAERFVDIRDCGKHNLRTVDVLSGGFPCQDISNAGKRSGIDGERSGLWSEYARIVRELRPRYVIVENVAALLGRGIERVLGDLAACGYDAEWQSIRASDVGAPHRRERIWIVAYPQRGGWRESTGYFGAVQKSLSATKWTEGPFVLRSGSQDVAYAQSERCPQRTSGGREVPDNDRTRLSQLQRECPTAESPGRRIPYADHWWASEPDVDRVADGIPNVVDRLRGLGNAIIPQIAEFIGRQILRVEQCP